MKRIVIAVGLMMLLFAVSAVAQTPAPKPGPEHKKLEIWVGDWTWEGELKATPFGPAGKVTGKATVRPTLCGFFLEWRGEETGPTGTNQSYEIDGYDPVAKKYTWNNFSSDGGVTTVTYTIEGTTVTYTGTQIIGGKLAHIRGTFVFTPELTSNTGKFEISADGKTWMPLAEYRNKIKRLSSK